MVGSTIGAVLFLLIHGNFDWENVVLMGYLTSELYINYLCAVIIFVSLISLMLNVEMNKYKEEKIKNEALTHALLN